jgi:hypothetical protein
LFQLGAEPDGAVSFVAQEAARFRLSDQFGRRNDVVPLPLGDAESQRKAQRVYDKVNLRRRTTP